MFILERLFIVGICVNCSGAVIVLDIEPLFYHRDDANCIVEFCEHCHRIIVL